MRPFRNWRLRSKILSATGLAMLVGSSVILWAGHSTYQRVSSDLIPLDREFAKVHRLIGALLSDYREYALSGQEETVEEIDRARNVLQATLDKVREARVSDRVQQESNRIEPLIGQLEQVGGRLIALKRDAANASARMHDLAVELINAEPELGEDIGLLGRQFAAETVATVSYLTFESHETSSTDPLASLELHRVQLRELRERAVSSSPLAREYVAKAMGLMEAGDAVVAYDRELGNLAGQLEDLELAFDITLTALSARMIESVDAEFARKLLGLEIGIVLLVLLTFLAIAFVVNTLVNRLRNIEETSRRFGAGDLDARAEVRGGDELGEVANGFNEMSEQVARSISEREKVESELRELSLSLESKVRERTEDLRNARDAAEAANVAKSQFLSNMSHELRTPLNAIIGYSEMLEEDARDDGDAATVKDLARITDAGRNLLGLINDVLDIAKIGSGKVQAAVKSFNVAEMLEGVAKIMAPRIEGNGNELKLRAPGRDVQMLSDEGRVRQVLLNLLSNAAKFTNGGQVSVEANQQLIDDTQWMEFLIRDSGVGMSKEALELAFQEFVQDDLSTTREYGGTGLGLPICKHLCELLGGKIELRSEQGKGTEVSVLLPLDLSADESTVTRTDLSALTVIEPSQIDTILIIDDDPQARLILQRHLSRLDCRILTASDGNKGLWLARMHRPDMIILDVCMPDADGWSVLKELKADDRTIDIPVIMCTIVDEEQYSFSLGASGYISKPVDRKMLLQTVARFSNGPASAHVLVVEDDAASRELIKRTLSKEGWGVAAAEDGVQGLARLKERRPDLILLDLMMPRMDGFEFIRNLKKQSEWQTIPVIVITAKMLTVAERGQLLGDVERIVDKDANVSIESLLSEITRAADTGAASKSNESVET